MASAYGVSGLVADWQVQAGGTLLDRVTGSSATVARAGAGKTVLNHGVISDVLADLLAVRPYSNSYANGRGYEAIIEEQRTNNFLRCHIMGATELAAWTADAGLTAAVRATVHGIYGSAKGVSLAADASNRAFWQQITATAVTWALSAYVWRDDGAAPTAADCQLCAVAGTTTPVGTLLTTTFTLVPEMKVGTSQVYRATATFTGTAAAWTAGLAVKANGSLNADLFQAGPGATSTSIIPTTSAPVTRAADVVSVPTAGWSAEAGMMVAVAADAKDSVIADWRKDGNNFISFQRGAGTYGNLAMYVKVTTLATASAIKLAGGAAVLAGSWTNGAASSAYIDGVKGTDSAAATTPTGMPATARIGCDSNGGYQPNAPLARILVFNRALTAAEVLLLQRIIGGPTSSRVPVLKMLGVL